MDCYEIEPLTGLAVLEQGHKWRAVPPVVEIAIAKPKQFTPFQKRQPRFIECHKQAVILTGPTGEESKAIAMRLSDGLSVPAEVPVINFLQGVNVNAWQITKLLCDNCWVSSAAFYIPCDEL